MIIKALAIAAAAGAISTAAFAQEYDKDTTSAQAPTTVNPAPPVDQSLAPAPTGVATEVVAISPDQARAQGIPVETIASAPVPDTRANRAKYGAPLSNAGKQTAPRGN